MAIGSASQPVYIDDLGIFKTCDVVAKLTAGSNIIIVPVTGSPGEYKISSTGGGGGGSGGAGGGVIDGTTWSDPVTVAKTFAAGTKQDIYTVAHDCCLYIKMTSAPVAGSIQFYIEDRPILSANDVAGNGPQGTSALIPVAAGTVISALVTESAATQHTFTFYEFKLNSLVPQLSFPDWNSGTRSDNLLESLKLANYNVTKNGFLYGNLCISSGKVTVKVNDVVVAVWYNLLSGEEEDYVTNVIPVSEGDVVSLTSSTGASFKGEIYFYVAKKTVSEADVRYSLPQITDGQLLDRANNRVTMTGNTTLKLPKLIEGKVRDFIVTITVAETGTLTFKTNSGAAFTSYMHDENTDDPLTQSVVSGGTYQFYFTEMDVDTFRVERTKLIGPS